MLTLVALVLTSTPSYSVVVTRRIGLEPERATALAAEFAQALDEHEGKPVGTLVPLATVRESLAEAGFPDSSVCSGLEKCVATLARLSQLSRLVSLQLVRVGADVAVDAAVIESGKEQGSTARAFATRLISLKNSRAELRSLAEELVAHLPAPPAAVAPSPTGTAPAATSPPGTTPATSPAATSLATKSPAAGPAGTGSPASTSPGAGSSPIASPGTVSLSTPSPSSTSPSSTPAGTSPAVSAFDSSPGTAVARSLSVGRKVAVGLGAGAVAALGVGFGLGGWSLGEAKRLSPYDPLFDQKAGELRGFATGADVAFVTAAALAVSAVLAWLLSTPWAD